MSLKLGLSFAECPPSNFTASFFSHFWGLVQRALFPLGIYYVPTYLPTYQPLPHRPMGDKDPPSFFSLITQLALHHQIQLP